LRVGREVSQDVPHLLLGSLNVYLGVQGPGQGDYPYSLVGSPRGLCLPEPQWP
jgi:hypothetical protein